MKILGKNIKGKLAISDYNRRIFNDFLKNPENDGAVIAIENRNPESKKARAFLHGSVYPMWAYLNGWDYRDKEVLDFLHFHGKQEFNGEVVTLDGKKIIKGKSTKGLLTKNDQAQSAYIERVIDYLEKNYGIERDKVLNPNHYKKFAEEIYMDGKYDDYIDYLQDIGLLKKFEIDYESM